MEGDEHFNKPDGQPAHLKVSPTGWKDTLVKYARNIKYWGLFRDMTVPMKFPKDGRKILKDRFWNTLGVESICKMGIMKLDKLTLPYTYSSWYLSELNMAKLIHSLTDVQVEALEGGVSKYFKAHENEVYEIPIDTDPEHKNVLYDGMDLIGNQSWDETEQEFQSPPPIPPFNTTGGFKFAIYPLIRNVSEGEGVNVIYNDQIFQELSTSSPFINQLRASDNCFAQCDPASTVDVNLNLDISDSFMVTQRNGPDTPTTHFKFLLRIVNATRDDTIVLYDDNPVVNAITTINYVNTILLHPGDKVFYTFSRQFDSTNGVATIFHFIPSISHWKVNFVSKVRATIVKGLYPITLFQKLFEKASGGLFQVKSDWLSAKKDIIITSGDALRGILTEYELDGITIKKQGAVIKTNISDFFKSMNHWGAMLGIEKDKLVIELFSHAFNTTIILNINEIVDWGIAVAEDIFFNTIRTGGPEVDYEDVNGKYEFNQGQTWSTPITKIVRELDLTTPYRRDPYGMEFIRKEFIGRTTTDGKSDNDTFMVNIETTEQPANDIYLEPYYKLYRPVYDLIEGIPITNAYNTELTPVHTILNNGSFIRSVLDKFDAQYLTLNTKDKNADLRTILAGVEVSQKNPIQIGSLAPRYFIPYYISGVTQGSISLLETIDNNPYGKIQLIINGKTFFSFLMDGGVKPADNDKQTWKMLSSAENIEFINI
ncbi:MAG TPA: hypothetical protein VLF89_03635 [Candidatus Saccharimonadales bacterium]|nr:hypothetical protein [Candidatus Saccharimonadales bacterium]